MKDDREGKILNKRGWKRGKSMAEKGRKEEDGGARVTQ